MAAACNLPSCVLAFCVHASHGFLASPPDDGVLPQNPTLASRKQQAKITAKGLTLRLAQGLPMGISSVVNCLKRDAIRRSQPKTPFWDAKEYFCGVSHK